MATDQRLFVQCLYSTLVITENDDVCSLDVGQTLKGQPMSPVPGLNDHC